MISNQMAQYGQTNPDEKELESISKTNSSNKDEQKRLYDQLLTEKLAETLQEKFEIQKIKLATKNLLKWRILK